MGDGHKALCYGVLRQAARVPARLSFTKNTFFLTAKHALQEKKCFLFADLSSGPTAPGRSSCSSVTGANNTTFQVTWIVPAAHRSARLAHPCFLCAPNSAGYPGRHVDRQRLSTRTPPHQARRNYPTVQLSLMLRRQRQSLQEHGNKKARHWAGGSCCVPEARLELAGEGLKVRRSIQAVRHPIYQKAKARLTAGSILCPRRDSNSQPTD